MYFDKTKSVKKIFSDYLPLLITFVLILVLGIKNQQTFIKMSPLFVTLIVNLLTAKVNKIAFLIGALNSIIYSIGYFQEGLYGSMAAALLYSLPLQLISFFLWKKNHYKQARTISIATHLQRVLGILALIASCCISVFIFSKFDGISHVIFEGTTFVLGLAATLLIMFGYFEGICTNLCSCILQLIMWVIIVINENAADITYLIISIYTTYRMIQSLINWIKLYKEQQISKTESISNSVIYTKSKIL